MTQSSLSRFMIYGGLIHAPLVFNWLRLAARLFPKDTTAHLLAKVAMDQACFAPVGLSSFYIGLSALEGKDSQGIYKEWREKMPNTWAVSFAIVQMNACDVIRGDPTLIRSQL